MRETAHAPQLRRAATVSAFPDRSPSRPATVTEQRLSDASRLANTAPRPATLWMLGDRIASGSEQMALPASLKAGMEARSGLSMADVRVYRNSPQPARLHALAFARGTDIHLAPGQERHLPHEAWHVVQQKQGRVRPTYGIAGVGVNDSPSLEREADVEGAASVRTANSAPLGLTLTRGAALAAPCVQLMKIRGAAVGSVVSNATATKHVVAAGDQQAAAVDGFGDTTFVTDNAALTGPVDADGYDFPDAARSRSARHDIHADVAITQYNKTNPIASGGLAPGQAVNAPVNETASCVIGVVKTGADLLSIEHFKRR